MENLVDAPRPQRLERILRRLGVSETTSRLLAVTPTLRAPWLVTVVLLLSASVVSGSSRPGERAAFLLLLLAPLVPVLGTALVFGRRSDVTAELTTASPLSGLRLVLIRTASVLLTSAAITGGASLLLPYLSWRVFGWLLPALALTTVTLALASRFRATSAAAAVATSWVVGVVGNEVAAAGGLRALRAGGPLEAVAFRPSGQVALLAVALVAALVVAFRRDAFETAIEGVW